MPDCILALDAGGTNLKYALMMPQGKPAPGCAVDQIPMDKGVLTAFEGAALAARVQADRMGFTIAMAGVCCPGPFDFRLGLSRMRHKWPDAYERPLAPVLRSVLGGELQVAFLHDSSAYMLGEGLLGAGCGQAHVAGVMLGTGLGFGHMHQGRVQVNADQRPQLSLWNTPFGEGIAEDYVSRRAIRARYAALSGSGDDLDVREIAKIARAGDSAALQTFAQTGALLSQILIPVLAQVGCAHVVLGGQIARSAQLLLPTLHLPATLAVASHLEDAALRGIARYCALGHEATIEEGEL